MTKPLAQITSGNIPVVASTDDNYAIPLTTMFVSLLKNASSPTEIELFVIDGGVTEGKKEKLSQAVAKFGAKVSFLEVNSDVYADFPTRNHISAPAYYRISIPELFSPEVEKCIYLDCDLIVKGDIRDLWEIDIEDHAIGAVENISNSTYETSKLDQQDYFNSGVMILNLKKWREGNISEQVRKFKLEHPELISTNDQCALNGVFRGKWKRLPLHWNQQSGLYRESNQVDRFRQNNMLDSALWNPSIIHYIGWSKPWLKPCFHPLENEYARYYDISPHSETPFKEIDGDRKKRWFSLAKKEFRKKAWQKKYKQRNYDLYDRKQG